MIGKKYGQEFILQSGETWYALVWLFVVYNVYNVLIIIIFKKLKQASKEEPQFSHENTGKKKEESQKWENKN